MHWSPAHPAWLTGPAATLQPTVVWSSLTDGQLVARTLGERPDAYGELIRRHQAAVYNVAFRLLGEREDALDVAQDAFVRAFDHLERFDQSRPFGPWINRIAVNLALSRLQRRPAGLLSLTMVSHPVTASAPELADRSGEPEGLYLAGEQQARVRQALLGLPPHYRAVIELRHFQERSYAEIASDLGLSLADVKSHLFRARRLLRAQLAEV